MRALMVLAYLAAMVSANLSVFWLGPWVSPINAFFLIGFDLTLRNLMQQRLTRAQMLGVIVAASLLSFALNPATRQIAMASACAFCCAAAVDWAIFSLLRRWSWIPRCNAANASGAAIDSVLFPTIAFGAFLPAIVAAQFAAKVAGGAMWSMALAKWRAA